SRGFFKDSLDATAGTAFAFSVKYGVVTYFDNDKAAAENPAWTRESGFTVNPTQSFVDSKQTKLPLFVLLAGLLIAVLSSILVRYVLIARLKAGRIAASADALSASDERYELAMRGMSVGLWDWDVSTNALYWSEKFKDIIGIPSADFVPHYRE